MMLSSPLTPDQKAAVMSWVRVMIGVWIGDIVLCAMLFVYTLLKPSLFNGIARITGDVCCVDYDQDCRTVLRSPDG